MHLASWLDRLNKEQQAAVTAPLQNTLVLAGAGSGKTRVLVNRIAWLVEEGHLDISAVMAVTFTNKAAAEMKQRLRQLLPDLPYDWWVGTFHGLAHRLLRRHAEVLKLNPNFQILDSDDQGRMIKRVLQELKLDLEQWPVKKAQSFINAQKDEGLRPQDIVVPSYGPQRIWLQIYEAYHQACVRADVVDFAELLLRALELFTQHPQILAEYQAQFRLILVDEFQDTNRIQYEWLKRLALPKLSLMAVGDDDQSIYGWRGAKVENIQRFTQDFAPVNVIRLEQNYRSTSTILQAANTLIAHNRERMGKSLWTAGTAGEKIQLYAAFNELEEAIFVRDQIRLAIAGGRRPEDIAILYRSNAQSRILEEALLRAGIAYRIHGGMRFFERAEIKDALAYLRLLVNPADDAALERAIHVPARGIGDKTLSHLRSLAHSENISLWQAMLQALDRADFTPRAATAVQGFISLFSTWSTLLPELDLSSLVSLVLEDSGLLMHYSEKAKEKTESKRENLMELVNAAEEFARQSVEPSLLNFLTQAALEAGEWQAQDHESYVHLMTLHAAKGLEFPLVFMVGMEEGVFPSQMSMEEPGRLEEERRLCYVGMTRSMESLVLSYAELRRQYGREQYHRPSRFLAELPFDLIHAIRPKTKRDFPVSALGSKPIEPNAPFQVGQKVSHAHFGFGQVLALEGQGEQMRIQVRFAQYGAKWLVLAYAKLKPQD